MAELTVTDSIKSLREMLCAAQMRVLNTPYGRDRATAYSQMLQRLINECDRHRPLGVNGKHGNLHTETCGCEDKGPRETWGTVTRVVHATLWLGEHTWCQMDVVPDMKIAGTYEEITCRECLAEIQANI